MPQRVSRMELIKQPVFWAAHLWNVSRVPLAEDDPENCDTAFGIATDVIEDFYLRELSSEKQWPVFCLPLQSGFSVEVVYANVPEDYQILYQLHHADWASAIRVGKSGGCWQLPAFHWSELLKISNAAGPNDAHSAAQALLLFFPAVWLNKEDDLNDVRRHLLNALKHLNLMPHRQAETLVEQLVVSCQSDMRWHRNQQLGWINDASNSRRNPASSVCLSRQEFLDLQNFMNVISD